MFNLKKEKAYDEMMVKLSEARNDLMTARVKQHVIGLYEFNGKFIDLLHQIDGLKKELAKVYSEMEIEEP